MTGRSAAARSGADRPGADRPGADHSEVDGSGLNGFALDDRERAELDRVVRTAVAEDLRYGPDATTLATVAADAVALGAFTSRADGVLAGGEVVAAVLAVLADPGTPDRAGRAPGAETGDPAGTGAGSGDPAGVQDAAVRILTRRADGTRLAAGDTAVVVRGPVRTLLTAERTALNLLCHLSGVATTTAAWVAEVAGTGAVIRDTRKTLPGLRALEKYAVRCGGGANHRMGLGDAVLIKDNHVAAAGSISAALAAVRATAPDLPCEVEVDTLDQLDEALALGAELVLLDNFTPAQTRAAVARRGDAATRLESSGGLTLATARIYAETGVDFLAVGALTHSVPALDLGLDLG